MRSSQPDSSQGWDSKVALWIFSYRAYEFTRYVVFLPPFRSKRTSVSNNFALTYYTYPPFVAYIKFFIRRVGNILIDVTTHIEPYYHFSNTYTC